MRIALVFPPYSHKIFSENLSVVDSEFCLGPPIILAYVAAILEKHGHTVILLDARALKLSKEEALQKLKIFKPDIIGFRAEAYYFYDALDWISYLKANLGLPVISGGPNLSLYPKETMSHSEIDYGFTSEVIETLPKFINALENNGNISGIAGLVYKNNGDIIVNPAPLKYADFDSYPFPARHLLPNDKYYSFLSQRKNFTIMVTSSGCPFHCSFCAIHPNTQYRERSSKNVVDEIEVCYKEFNIREIDFFDASIFVNKPRLLRVFSEIKRRGIKMEWSCRSRVDIVSKELLREAAQTGCRQIYYGIESADASILRAVNKQVGIEQMRMAIKWSKDFGIRTMGFFMVGNPEETKESVWRSIEFAKELGLDFVQVCRTIAKPNTELDKFMIKKTHQDYWREHIRGKRIQMRLPTPWISLAERDLESLTRRFYLSFYMRLGIILIRLFQLKSISELLRYVRVAIKMLFYRSKL